MTPENPDVTADDWQNAEAEYLARLDARIDELLTVHRWDGGYFCRCGIALNSPNGWGRHVLYAAVRAGL